MLNEEQKHQTKYFIKKFEATKEEEWCTGAYHRDERYCALGHVGERNGEVDSIKTTESRILRGLLPTEAGIVQINDGADEQYRQPTPRQRVLAALYDLLKS